MTANLIAFGLLFGFVALLLWGTHKVSRGGPWVARIAPAMKALQDSAFTSKNQPGVRFLVEERRKQSIIRTDQAQGDPPGDIDLDLGTVALPTTAHGAPVSDNEWDEDLLARLIDLGRAGDFRGMLRLPADPADDDDWTVSWEGLAAMTVLDALGTDAMVADPNIYDVVDHHVYRHDDDEHVPSQLALEAAVVFATDRYGLADPVRARECCATALTGPDPDGVWERLDALGPAMTPAVRAELDALRAAAAGGPA